MLIRKLVAALTVAVISLIPMSAPDYRPSFYLDATMLPYGVPDVEGLVLYDSGRNAGYPDANFIAYNRTLISVGNTGVAAAYAEKSMGAPVTRIGVDFKIAPGSYGGSVALALWAWSGDGGGPWVPDSPAHVVINLNDWAFQIFRNGQNIGVASGTFSPALPPNTPLRADIRINRSTGVATMDLPNGKTVTITDSRVKLAANFAVFESWRMYAESQGQPQIITAWADTR